MAASASASEVGPGVPTILEALVTPPALTRSSAMNWGMCANTASCTRPVSAGS